MAATFLGMRPWGSDAGIIECDGTEVGLVDLHNECDFLEVRATPGSDTGLVVSLMFRHQSTHRNISLSFAAVSDFSVVQLDHHPDDALLFHDIGHVSSASGPSTFEVVSASMRMDFRASTVEFLLL